MTKEEFIALASAKWDEINTYKEESQNLYEYEKGFDELWVDFGRNTLEGSIGEVPENHRKKKDFEPLRNDFNCSYPSMEYSG